MKLLNLACGGTRPQDEHWWNLDHLMGGVLQPGTPEYMNLSREPRYVNFMLNPITKMPFDDGEFDGLLASHCVEHWDCHTAVSILADCRRILRPGGLLVVSVPDAEYFLKVYGQDKPENAVELFGEPISESWQPNFFSYALFKEDHIQILTRPALACLLVKAGFPPYQVFNIEPKPGFSGCFWDKEPLPEILKIMNRRKFSVELAAIKSAEA